MVGKRVIIIIISLLFILNINNIIPTHDSLNFKISESERDNKDIIKTNSTSLFLEPVLIEDMNARKMVLCDYDNNGFPDIIHYHKDGYNDPLGMFHVQMNKSGIWNKTKINDLAYIKAYTNLSGDDTRDFLHHTGIEYHNHLVISEMNSNGSISRTFTHDKGSGFSHIMLDDVDIDGDLDLILGYSSNYVQVYQNLGEGEFNYDWDNGIPDRAKDPNLPSIDTEDLKVGDIDCNGLPDIATATKCSMGYGFPPGSRYFLMLNEGDGNWTDASMDFPRGKTILNIDLADLDNDGDLDYGILGQDEGWIYENIDGKKWNVRPFPNFHNQIDYFTFEDIDLDGNEDILVRDVIFKDETTLFFEINISFGNGDYTWKTVNQMSKINNSYYDPIFEDFDRDGDLDIVMRGGGIYFWENNISIKPNMSFIKTPSSTHFRSGYLTEFSWTMKDAYKICKRTEDLEFNLSISYTGPKGPFFHMKTVKGQWWTDLIIPDMPSNDVYFKINFSDYSTLSGPYTIHDSNGMGSLVELTEPEYDSFLIGGEEVDITLRTSNHLQTGTYPIYLVSEGNRSHLGSFHLQSGENNSFKIKIPHGFYSTYGHLEVSIPWFGNQREVDTVSRFQVIPTHMVPHHFDLSEHHVPAGYKTNITVPVFSINGTDISSDCDYKILGKSNGIKVYPYKDGIINITCSDVGRYNFTLSTKKFSKAVMADIMLISHRNLHTISLFTPETECMVGEPLELFFRGLDPDGKYLQIDEELITWEITGNCEYSIQGSALMVIPHSPGTINISAEADTGLGPVTGSVELEVYPTIERTRITTNEKSMMNGSVQDLYLNIWTNDNQPISNYQITWTSNDNAAIISHSLQNAVIKAVKEGEIEIRAVLRHYDETFTSTTTIDVYPAPGSIRMDKEIIQEIGRSEEYQLEILTTNNFPFEGDHFIGSYLIDPEIASVSIEDNILTVIGDEEGETELILNLSTMEGISFESTFPVSIRSSPDRISIGNYPEYPRTGQSFQVDFSVFNYREDELKGFSVDLKSNLTEIEIIDYNHFSVLPMKSGYDEIIITVEKYGVEIESKINFRIVPTVSEVLIEMDSFEVPVNTGNGFSLILKDPAGNEIPWTDFQFNMHRDIAIEESDNGFNLNGSGTGTYQIFYTTEYFGRTLEGSFNVTLYEISILSEIQLTFDENSRVVEVLCLDQNSDNITSLCSIQWSGDFQVLNDYKVISRSEKLSVTVTLNETSLEDEIDTPVSEDKEKETSLIMIFIISIPMIILIVVGIFIILGKTRKINDEKSGPE